MLISIGLHGKNSKVIALKEIPEYIIPSYIFFMAYWVIVVKRKAAGLMFKLAKNDISFTKQNKKKEVEGEFWLQCELSL